ncbi:hypothetical protein HK099_003891 [Clydaea vesicula]|uniref:Uncharacterized protein n=1 Tax=Clydaea vesicula TaxID=447962 RepID=A0AAD5U2Z7_9FUNG|nr:hypothetical protein HK099_003891 [Clydaea vesicula]
MSETPRVIRRDFGGKSSSEWTNDDIENLNIKTEHIKSFNDFFNMSPPVSFSNPDINKLLEINILDIVSEPNSFIRDKNMSWKIKTFIKDLVAVTRVHRNEESAVDDMAKTLLALFEYDDNGLTIRSRPIIKLNMAGTLTQANPDICIEETDTCIKLLVQEDKSANTTYNNSIRSRQAEPQLIAEAIAAYQSNCEIRKTLGEEDKIEECQEVPGITLIEDGYIPAEKTIVRKYIIPGMPIDRENIMLSSRHIKIIAQCYEAFKRFIID